MGSIQKILERKRDPSSGSLCCFIETDEYFVQKILIDVEFPFVSTRKIHIHQNFDASSMELLLAQMPQFILNIAQGRAPIIPIQKAMV
jgi:hypothetical protein